MANRDWRKELIKLNAEIMLLERKRDRLLESNLEKPSSLNTSNKKEDLKDSK